ncbi:hypothetical protein G7Y89_g14893 [Cudoniella acicularis]|uniref:Zn(2)-C6 fungal-type domain-containing protein n=1 Tax=Cudoniella acicularis TaxID=354080 RepID=A0A8H4QVQ6_9HELO|nr:hypothetical protein G7Y89_g14893 [Cudoniella acicularis]
MSTPDSLRPGHQLHLQKLDTLTTLDKSPATLLPSQFVFLPKPQPNSIHIYIENNNNSIIDKSEQNKMFRSHPPAVNSDQNRNQASSSSSKMMMARTTQEDNDSMLSSTFFANPHSPGTDLHEKYKKTFAAYQKSVEAHESVNKLMLGLDANTDMEAYRKKRGEEKKIQEEVDYDVLPKPREGKCHYTNQDQVDTRKLDFDLTFPDFRSESESELTSIPVFTCGHMKPHPGFPRVTHYPGCEGVKLGQFMCPNMSSNKLVYLNTECSDCEYNNKMLGSTMMIERQGANKPIMIEDIMKSGFGFGRLELKEKDPEAKKEDEEERTMKEETMKCLRAPSRSPSPILQAIIDTGLRLTPEKLDIKTSTRSKKSGWHERERDRRVPGSAPAWTQNSKVDKEDKEIRPNTGPSNLDLLTAKLDTITSNLDKLSTKVNGRLSTRQDNILMSDFLDTVDFQELRTLLSAQIVCDKNAAASAAHKGLCTREEYLEKARQGWIREDECIRDIEQRIKHLDRPLSPYALKDKIAHAATPANSPIRSMAMKAGDANPTPFQNAQKAVVAQASSLANAEKGGNVVKHMDRPLNPHALKDKITAETNANEHFRVVKPFPANPHIELSVFGNRPRSGAISSMSKLRSVQIPEDTSSESNDGGGASDTLTTAVYGKDEPQVRRYPPYQRYDPPMATISSENSYENSDTLIDLDEAIVVPIPAPGRNYANSKLASNVDENGRNAVTAGVEQPFDDNTTIWGIRRPAISDATADGNGTPFNTPTKKSATNTGILARSVSPLYTPRLCHGCLREKDHCECESVKSWLGNADETALDNPFSSAETGPVVNSNLISSVPTSENIRKYAACNECRKRMTRCKRLPTGRCERCSDNHLECIFSARNSIPLVPAPTSVPNVTIVSKTKESTRTTDRQILQAELRKLGFSDYRAAYMCTFSGLYFDTKKEVLVSVKDWQFDRVMRVMKREWIGQTIEADEYDGSDVDEGSADKHVEKARADMKKSLVEMVAPLEKAEVEAKKAAPYMKIWCGIRKQCTEEQGLDVRHTEAYHGSARHPDFDPAFEQKVSDDLSEGLNEGYAGSSRFTEQVEPPVIQEAKPLTLRSFKPPTLNTFAAFTAARRGTNVKDTEPTKHVMATTVTKVVGEAKPKDTKPTTAKPDSRDDDWDFLTDELEAQDVKDIGSKTRTFKIVL